MKYKGKAIEILGIQEVLNQKTAWIRILEDDKFLQIPYDEIDKEETTYSLPLIRYIAIAAKIKDEVAKKNILAPYESSLIPLPHQILVLEKVMKSDHNRFLLADEVGMGKTIETGLILKELKLRGEVKRILTIVPKSSMLQWQTELKDHFNEVFHIYDSEMIGSLARTFSNLNADQEFNFWKQHNQIIVSTDALKPLEKRQGWSQEKIDEYNKYRIEAVLNADFDMLIIDEAHKMGGASQTVSRYQLAQALCNTVPNVLLLTATPHRGKSDHFRRVLQLLDPDAFDGEGLPMIDELEPYVIRTEKRHAVDYEGTKLFNERKTVRFDVFLDINKHQKQIQLYKDVSNYVKNNFNKAKRRKNNAVGLIMVLFQRLMSSSTAAILSAMEGRLLRLSQSGDDIDAYSSDYDYNENDHIDNINFDDLYTDISGDIEDEEQILSDLITQAKDCLNTEIDAKADAFLNKYSQLQQEYNDKELKILIFTEFRTTQKMLYELFIRKGIKTTFINGSQDLDERQRALVVFKKEAQILIATDAAGESLNMQFAHIVFNYDLPWNPMMIEQRIGRVDRIGQKHVVKAFNMLTNNSIDLRVYKVIEEKLSRILEQLGIDKSSDVLDSTIDMKKINQLYLQSLLDPKRFEFSGEKWLHEIKSKLKDFQSTEGILPVVKEGEIESKKAADVKYSPLPIWLEDLMLQYTIINNGTAKKNLLGYYQFKIDGITKKITFDSEVSLNDPSVEHITLQHDLVTKILNNLEEFNSTNSIPKLKYKTEDETPGIWSIWEISAKNNFDNKTIYHSFFIADNGKNYSAYANDIWNRLVSNKDSFDFVGYHDINNDINNQEIIDNLLLTSYQNLEVELSLITQKKLENKIKSYNYQKSRINKIGIENIRLSKLNKLEIEHDIWMKEFESNSKSIPKIKHLLSIRIDD